MSNTNDDEKYGGEVDQETVEVPVDEITEVYEQLDQARSELQGLRDRSPDIMLPPNGGKLPVLIDEIKGELSGAALDLYNYTIYAEGDSDE